MTSATTSGGRLGPRLVVWSAGVALAGCSLWVSFDPNGQPCDAKQGCLAGYGCVQGTCQKRTGTVTCDVKKCPVGTGCQSPGANCVAVPAGQVGSLCDGATPCVGGLTCWQGAALVEDAGLQGVCVSSCSGGCTAAGSSCQTFSMALDAGEIFLCLPSNLLWPCASDSDCALDGLVCTVFDSPSLGAATACAQPVQGGGSQGQACDAGAQCADGLCLSGTCVPTCGPSTCISGQSCLLTEYESGSDVRFFPGCIAAPTFCEPCGVTVSCGADAPKCTLLPSGLESACFADCASPGSGLRCPPQTACDAISGRCMPDGGVCPGS